MILIFMHHHNNMGLGQGVNRASLEFSPVITIYVLFSYLDDSHSYRRTETTTAAAIT